ncbi:hypothetical protein L6164_031686 [Bauhinia variegata]|uniref:Uncharacterized protein n=1 Tax=Bauhinia variegata TaxID=167791 RepID=A0ACB9LG87_BAUVA|nr:hypothetical protein L6164_031686 [Bauhinia variegata]
MFSYSNPATQLANSKQVQAVIGTQLNESELVAKIYKTSKKLPIISLTSMATPESNPVPLPYFIQMANDVTIHMQCLADIVGQFRWRKVTAIYEQNDGFTSNSSILTYLSNNLWDVNSEIDEHVAFPSLASLSDPKATIEQKLKSLQKKSNRVFLIVQSSLEFAVMLFEKANQMGMIEKGSAWIISDSVASHLDSLDPSVTDNMQGILGCKTNFSATSSKFRNFKFKFRGKFLSEFPKEENQEPSLFALRAYDTIWAIFLALKKSQGNFSLEAFSKSILSSNFDGLSGKISFKNGRLNQAPIFKIVNVFGRSYKELAFWSNISGFSKYPVTHQAMEGRSQNNSSGVLGTVNWPGGSQTVPKGWVYRYEGKPLKIGVPLNGACPHLMHVSYDQNKTKVTGFSADVFRKSSKHLPYDLSYDFVPFNGTYNEMVKHVNNKDLNAAIGDIEIMSNRYQYVQFAHPYVDSGVTTIVRVKPDRSKQTWMFMDAFTKEMWLLLATMHLYVGLVIWIIERGDNSELKGFGAMLWFSVTMLFFTQREPVRRNLARFVLAPWLVVILIVTTSFTASLTSMMTVSHLEPSVPDLQTLKRTNAIVGCNRRSFMCDYLTNKQGFKPENIKRFDSLDEYPRSLENNEIKAAILIAPQAEIFLATYCKGYITAGTPLTLGGLGFVFPRGSRLAVDMSEAVLESIERGEVQDLKKKMLSTTNCRSSDDAEQDEKLGPQPFFGLFYISGTIASLGLVFTMVHFAGRNVKTSKTWQRIRSMKRSLIPERNRQGETFTNELLGICFRTETCPRAAYIF